MGQRRSIIIDNKTTSISLEEVFWHELDRIASEKGVAWQDFLREILQSDAELSNRAAAVKEFILQYLKQEYEEQGSVFNAVWELKAPGETRIKETKDFRILVGRSSECEMRLYDPEVSRVHCMLVWDNRNWWIIDLKSKNGVFVDNKRIEVLRLKSNQSFRVGQTRIRALRQST